MIRDFVLFCLFSFSLVSWSVAAQGGSDDWAGVKKILLSGKTVSLENIDASVYFKATHRIKFACMEPDVVGGNDWVFKNMTHHFKAEIDEDGVYKLDVSLTKFGICGWQPQTVSLSINTNSIELKPTLKKVVCSERLPEKGDLPFQRCEGVYGGLPDISDKVKMEVNIVDLGRPRLKVDGKPMKFFGLGDFGTVAIYANESGKIGAHSPVVIDTKNPVEPWWVTRRWNTDYGYASSKRCQIDPSYLTMLNFKEDIIDSYNYTHTKIHFDIDSCELKALQNALRSHEWAEKLTIDRKCWSNFDFMIIRASIIDNEYITGDVYCFEASGE